MDLAKIEELIQIVREANVSELTVRREGSSITIKKGAGASRPGVVRGQEEKASTPQPEEPGATAAEPEAEIAVTAPMVGIFHLVDPALQSGALVKAGQALGAIESMKLMNEIECDYEGKIVKIMVENSQPVEYNQVLFLIEPN